ncbi:MAG: CAP domain-containing protein [Actinomycetota bacterium]|nr:CAP domain-containing protein [Actinomycetota bacterium]
MFIRTPQAIRLRAVEGGFVHGDGMGVSAGQARPHFVLGRADAARWRIIGRTCALLLAIGLVWGLVASSAQGVGHPEFLDGSEYQVLVGINHFRAEHGLRALSPSRALTGAAGEHSRDMLRRRYYAHNTLNGRSWNRRIKHYVRASMVGETLDLLYGPPGRGNDARTVVYDWIHSPAHRAVLLTPRLRRIGVGRATKRRGRPAVFTADFAN